MYVYVCVCMPKYKIDDHAYDMYVCTCVLMYVRMHVCM
jgi:hypothetical protein